MEPSDAEVLLIREAMRRWLAKEGERNRVRMLRARDRAIIVGDTETARAIEAALEPLVQEES